MRLDSIHQIMDKKLIKEEQQFPSINDKYSFMKSRNDEPILRNKFETVDDVKNICKVGTEFYEFDENGNFKDVCRIIGTDPKLSGIQFKEENSGLTWNFGYNGVFLNIRYGLIIPFIHTENYDGDDTEIDD